VLLAAMLGDNRLSPILPRRTAASPGRSLPPCSTTHCFTQYTNISTDALDCLLQAVDALVLVGCGSDGGEGPSSLPGLDSNGVVRPWSVTGSSVIPAQ